MNVHPAEPPCTDPYARWCGRGGAARLPPIPIGEARGWNETCCPMKFEIQPVTEPVLGEVAAFLHRWHSKTGKAPAKRAVRKGPANVERCLRWLLAENPLTDDASQHGFCARDSSGVIRGLTLNFPWAFTLNGRAILGLCSGSYFVEPEVRTAGFFLFRKYLETPGYSLFFATTCNANSSALWQRVGGAGGPGSQVKYILPIRFDVVIPAMLGRRVRSKLAIEISRRIGRCGNLASRLLTRRSATLAVEPCRDWDKLSSLSRYHMPRDLMTADRSVAFLRWRYGERSPNRDSEICVFRDTKGNEGWFALGWRMLGSRGEVHACIVLDAVWPRDQIDFGQILMAIVRRVANVADAVYFPPRPRLDYQKFSRWIISRTLEAPQVWGVAGEAASVSVTTLDLVYADGDSGWSNRYENEPASSTGRSSEISFPSPA